MIEKDEQQEENELKALKVEGKLKLVVEHSINFVVGSTNLGTTKMKGKIREESVIILIDCGATHNLISEKLVAL